MLRSKSGYLTNTRDQFEQNYPNYFIRRIFVLFLKQILKSITKTWNLFLNYFGLIFKVLLMKSDN